MYQTRKIGVVGQGHVGAHVANSLLMQGIADELYLCDINEAKVTSEVQDLRDSLSFVPYNTKIVNCYDHYEELACCDVIVNAAGKVASAAGNRDGELFFTTDAARTFAKRIVDAGFDGIFVSISNPCDVVCTELWHLTGYDPKKIIGSGCGLDSARLRTEISKKVGVSPQVHRRLHDRRARLAASPLPLRPQPSLAKTSTSFRRRNPRVRLRPWRSRSLHARAAM